MEDLILELAYIRISSKDQNPERQIKKFQDLKIDDRYIYIDKSSGKDFDRPQYQAMLLIIREGDLIYLDALDRLGRDYNGGTANISEILYAKLYFHLKKPKTCTLRIWLFC